ncbi:hypothetical protein L1987_46332 [Smallanthus sonchifolius]|uniref:Uncharacterized protein n=1 Tax=Smallanthus sonchifolius TaxID=185202 RepID=A0ACB9G0G8_9ASTR|nr:hypothetical protein L1987_46332 [Smallanthus sonchifolius]
MRLNSNQGKFVLSLSMVRLVISHYTCLALETEMRKSTDREKRGIRAVIGRRETVAEEEAIVAGEDGEGVGAT